MSGFLPMLRKEAVEVRRTSRLYVLPAVLVFCALSGSVLTYFLPVILSAATTGTPGLSLDVTQQTVADAMIEYFSQLSQFGLLAVVIASAGLISGELRSGTILLVVTKPISRAAFILSKVTSQTLVVIASTLLGTLVFGISAHVLFGSVPLGRLLAAIAAWILIAVVFVCLMVLVGSRMNSSAGAAGIGIGLYAVISVLGIWAPLKAHSPAGLLEAGSIILRGGDALLLWPTVSAVVLAALALAGAVFSFRHREL